MLAAAAAASVVTIDNVPLVPAVNTAVSLLEPVIVMALPSIATSSTVKAVSVPSDVILPCAAVVTVAAVPETLPVTSPVNGPAKASEVTVPSKNASLNSTELVPKSMLLSLAGTRAPSTNLI